MSAFGVSQRCEQAHKVCCLTLLRKPAQIAAQNVLLSDLLIVQILPALLHRPPAANLAVAWEKDVSLWELPLAPSAGQGQQAAPAGQQSANAGARGAGQADDLMAGGAARQLQAWHMQHLVVGAAWLDAQCLAVLSEAGPEIHIQFYDAAGKVACRLSTCLALHGTCTCSCTMLSGRVCFGAQHVPGAA